MEHNKNRCRGINFTNLVFGNAFFNDGSEFFTVVTALGLEIGEIGFIQVFPLPVTHIHILVVISHLFDMKTEELVNLGNRLLVTGLNRIDRGVIDIRHIKADRFQDLVLGTDMVIQTGGFNAY